MEYSECILQEYPYPLAVAAKKFNDADKSVERFLCLANVIETMIKYLATVTIMQYLRDDQVVKTLQDNLEKLKNPTLAHWNEMLWANTQHYREHPDRPCMMPELRDLYSTKWRVNAKAFQKISEGFHFVSTYLGKEREAKWKRISIQNFFDLMVQYRDQAWGHGIVRLDANTCNEHVAIMQPALEEMYQHLSFLKNYPLFYIKEVKMEGGKCVHYMYKYMGLISAKSDSYIGPYKRENRLYICDQERKPLLSLHPLLVIDNKKELYVLEYNDKDKQIGYTNCRTGESYEPQKLESYRITRLADDEHQKFGDIELPVPPESSSETLPEPPLNVLIFSLSEILTHLAPDAREGLEAGLGEAIRLGHFWLGIEFVLMGFSRFESNGLWELLQTLEVDSGELRGKLRGLVGIRSKDWRQQKDVQLLGIEMLPRLQEASTFMLVDRYAEEQVSNPIITPRLLRTLRNAIQIACGEQANANHVLLAIMKHHHNLAVNLLLKLMVEHQYDPRQFIERLGYLSRTQPEQIE